MTLYTYGVDIAAKLDDFLVGGAKPDLVAHRSIIDLRDLLASESPDLELVRDLTDHALALDFESNNDLDGWLAPRLHAALRLPIRMAAEPGIWRWIAIEVMSPYVRRRWGKDGGVTSRNYMSSDRLKNSCARLWWIAELSRNGTSYDLVPRALSSVRVAQFALELKYSWFRPAALAFVRVATGMDDGPKLSDRELRALSVRVNAYLSLRSLEAMGLSAGDQRGYDEEWRKHRVTLDELTRGELPLGPNDGIASEASIVQLAEWFRELAREYNPES